MEADQDVKKQEPVFIAVYVWNADLDVRAFAPPDFCRTLARQLADWGLETRERYCSPCG